MYKKKRLKTTQHNERRVQRPWDMVLWWSANAETPILWNHGETLNFPLDSPF